MEIQTIVHRNGTSYLYSKVENNGNAYTIKNAELLSVALTKKGDLSLDENDEPDEVLVDLDRAFSETEFSSFYCLVYLLFKSVGRQAEVEDIFKSYLKYNYDVLSPDGFAIEMDGYYKNLTEVDEAIARFVKRYEQQGYYSSNSGRISLDILPQCLDIIQVEKD